MNDTEHICRLESNPKQTQFFESKAKYTAYGGARGGGKSWAMRTKLILLAIRYPGINILLLRRTLGELRENHILPMRQLLEGFAEYRESGREFLFPNGARIRLGYCDAENDVLQYQGQSYDVIGLEEATHFTYFQFQCLTECNRSSGMMKCAFRPRMYLTCNPGGVGNDWVKRLFVDRIYRGSEDPENYVFIKSLVYDNAFLMKNDPDYVKTLEALPEIRRRAMLYGDWNAFEGAFFPEFDEERHITVGFDIPSDWLRFRALDYGLDMTACLWMALSPEKNVYVYRELYQNGLILSEAAKKILSLTPKDEKIRYTVASPDLWSRRQDSGRSGFDIMCEAGLRGLRKADNSRIAGWRVVREYLNGSEPSKPGLIIFRCCENLLRTLPQLRFDEHIREDAASEPHELTHAPEALRYGLMSRTPKTEIKPGRFTSKVWSFERPREEDGYHQFINY